MSHIAPVSPIASLNIVVVEVVDLLRSNPIKDIE